MSRWMIREEEIQEKIFAIPLAFEAFSLVANADKIKPKTWLIIYGGCR